MKRKTSDIDYSHMFLDFITSYGFNPNNYENILELYNELHEVLEECNPQKFRKIEKTEILITKEYFEKALNHEVNTNFEVTKLMERL